MKLLTLIFRWKIKNNSSLLMNSMMDESTAFCFKVLLNIFKYLAKLCVNIHNRR